MAPGGPGDLRQAGVPFNGDPRPAVQGDNVAIGCATRQQKGDDQRLRYVVHASVHRDAAGWLFHERPARGADGLKVRIDRPRQDRRGNAGNG